MYKNIGRKIKGFAIGFAWTLVAVACFFAFYTVFKAEEITSEVVIPAVALILGGSVLALFISWFIYAYGVIVENTEKTRENFESVINEIYDINEKLNKLSVKTVSQPAPNNSNEDIPLENFKFPSSREELFQSQLKKLKRDYEMSRITYDEYEESKRKLEEKYR